MSEQRANGSDLPEKDPVQTMDESKPTVLVFQMGHNDSVGQMFVKIFNSHGLHVETVKAVDGETPSKSSLEEYHGIVITGSAYMVTDQHPWSLKVANLVRGVVERGDIPVLGICFGHQLLLHTFGATVDYIGERQIGSRVCKLTPAAKADPLFSVFNGRETIAVHVLHRQNVQGNLPAFVQILASNPIDKHHACRVGKKCWSVQFHPELRTKNIRAVIEFQKDALPKDGLDYNQVVESIIDSSDGALLLERFAAICQEHYDSLKLAKL